MRLARFSVGDNEPRAGIVEGDEVVDIGAAAGDTGLVPYLVADRHERGATHALPDVRLLAPVARPPKLLAIGLNYAEHVAETGRDAPSFPLFFNKQATCVIGPGDGIVVPRVSAMVDYEGELAVVIGRRCRHVPAQRAAEVIAGFTVINDVTVRDWQAKAPTMTIGKSFDTHGPLGPWVVTPDEVGDPHDLRLRTWVNGELLQDASTNQMIHDCYQQVATLTTSFTLEPGDVIATGTPAGVGFTREPPIFLKAGDTVRIEIEGIGTLENPVVDEPDDAPRIG